MPTPKPIWIASYPKSGNTWVRFIVTALTDGTVQRSDRVEHLVQDVHKRRAIALPKEGDLFLKTHWMLSEGMPESSNTKAVIYVVRNPLDIVASVLSYLQVGRSEGGEAVVNEFVRFGGLSSWRDEGYGSWEENVESWALSPVTFPRLLVRYEDLQSDTPEQVRRIAEFLGLDAKRGRIEKVVADTSFARLRQLETREVTGEIEGLFMAERRLKQRIRNATGPERQFMNRGTVGSFLDVLSQSQNRSLLTRFAPMMARIGYDVASYDRALSERGAAGSKQTPAGSD